MDANQKLLLRNALLCSLEASAPASLPLSTLHQSAKLAGHPVGPDEVRVELDYLVGKGFAEECKMLLSAGITRWKLTAAGRDYLESQGL